MRRTTRLSLATGIAFTLAAAMTTAHAGDKHKDKDNTFSDLVTPDAIFGSGNSNGGFTVDRHQGVEVGLRGKTRFPAPVENGDNGDGTYSYPAGDACPGFGFAPFPLCLNTPKWSFDWSVNTDYAGGTGNKLDDFVYQLGMDADPGPGTDFTLFDPITPNAVPPAWDHSLGTNATGNGAGIEDVDPPTYLANLGTFNVAQNSWNYEFFNNIGTSLASFNPAGDGNYVVFLRAIDPAKNKVVAESVIQILTGAAAPVKRNKIKLPKVK
ncbi:hypothetical protein [Piscinibacter sakaiensis]|uniref:hypothetical protein n=1 Tax=Piscinibacter sakaiensis TaxID=1547922 RepID=UPI003AAF7521